VKDSDGWVFACFSPDKWKKCDSYYGNGEVFLLTLHPHFATYKWAGADDHFLLSTDTFLAVGGGNNFAFWLDSFFHTGTSQPCATFGSPSLIKSPSGQFSCSGLEAWEFCLSAADAVDDAG